MDAARQSVSPLELLFDLVFVFTVAQVAFTVDHHPGPEGIAQAVVIFVLLYWMYGGFAWLTNSMGTSTPAARATVVAGMGLLLVTSLAVPRAFGDDGLVFGVAYALLTVVHLLGFWKLAGPAAAKAFMSRIGPVNLVGAVMVLAAGFVTGPLDWLLLALPGAAHLAILATAVFADGFDLEPGHFAERHALMIIIALGESLIATAFAAQAHVVDAALLAGSLAGFAVVVGFWWTYFSRDAERAPDAFGAASGRRRGLIATNGFDITHQLMIIGIILVAAGVRMNLERLTDPASTASAATLALGAGLFLTGTALFRHVLGLGPSTTRWIAAALVLATTVLGTSTSTLIQLAVVAVVLIALGVAERLVSGPFHGGVHPPTGR